MNKIHILPLEATTSNALQQVNPKAYMFLTHLCDDADYVRSALEYNGYRILDNSLIELGGAVSIQELMQAADKIHAHEIILPDVFQNGPATLKAVEKATSTFKTIMDFEHQGYKWIHNHRPKFMAVAQGRDVEEFTACYNELRKLISTGDIDVIGIPKVCAKMHPIGRPGFESLWCHDTVEIHLLGLWYAWTELDAYVYPERIRSVDSVLGTYLFLHNMRTNQVRPDGYTVDLAMNMSQNQRDRLIMYLKGW